MSLANIDNSGRMIIPEIKLKKEGKKKRTPREA